MKSFRLHSLEINTKKLKTETIKLHNSDILSNANFFTLLIGDNGTGKSRILSETARFFINKEKPKSLNKDNFFEFENLPSKIIALTNSISDKFPKDASFKNSSDENQLISQRDFYYNYLGTRNKINSFSNKSLMNRALEIVIENYSKFEISENYRHIFSYLNYEPVIKLKYRFNRRFIDEYKRNRNVSLVSYQSALNSRRIFFEKEDKSLNRFVNKNRSSILRFLDGGISEGHNELLINFSRKNIDRIQLDDSISAKKLNEFEIISVLRKLRIINTFEIGVFKKGGEPFNYSDASSGEANILSTLLALVPILKNNCLVLIDEPEISLHPTWQAKYIDLLKNIFESISGCHIVIATHSPFLASDLNPKNSSVVSLENSRGIITSKLINHSTYGWSSEDILLNVFKMKTTRNNDLYNNISNALQLLGSEKKTKHELNKINHTLREFYPSILSDDPLKIVLESIFDASNDE